MDDSQTGSHARSPSELASAVSEDGINVNLDLLRDWALSLSRQRTSSTTRTEREGISHIILRDPKLPDGDMPRQNLVLPLDAVVVPSRRGRQRPPKASRLGPVTPPWMEGQHAAIDDSQLARAAAAAKKEKLTRYRRPRSALAARANEQIFETKKSPSPFPQRPAIPHQLRRRHLLVGTDLFAGSPFSTDAQLDPLTQKVGIYNVQCRHGRLSAMDRYESFK